MGNKVLFASPLKSIIQHRLYELLERISTLVSWEISRSCFCAIAPLWEYIIATTDGIKIS